MSPLSTLTPIVPGINAGARSVVALTANDRLVAVDVAGFWRTHDDAGRWREANSMTLSGAFEVVTQTSHFSLFKHPTQPSTAYAVNVDGVLKSTDKGRNWVYKFHPAVAGAAWGGFALAVGDPNRLAIGRGSRLREGGVNKGQVYLCPDGGDNWHGPFDVTTEDIYIEARALAFRPSDDMKLYVATNTGIFVLTIDWGDPGIRPPTVTGRERFEFQIPGSGTGSSKRCEWLGFNPLAASDELWLTMRHDPLKPNGGTVYNGGVLQNRFAPSNPWEIRMGSGATELPQFPSLDEDLASQYTMLVFRTASEAYIGTDVSSLAVAIWGVWKTADNGGSWSHVTDAIADLEANPSAPARVWGDGPENDRAHSRFVALALSPDRNTLYAAGNAEIFKSSTGADFAQKWTSEYSTFHTFIDNDAYAKDRGGPYGFRPNSVLVWDNGNRVVIGTGDRFGLLSKDGSTSWRQMKRTAAVTRGENGMVFVVDPLDANRLFGAVVKSNADLGLGGVIRSTTGGLTWMDWNGSSFPDVGALDIIAYLENSVTKLIVAADGATNDRGIYLCANANPPSGPPVYAHATIPGTSNKAKKLYRAADGRIYLAMEKDDSTPGGIFRSDGASWTNITGSPPGSASREDCLWVYGDPNDAKKLYIGCHGADGADGGVWRTLDATATPVVWEKIYGGSATFPGSPPNGSRAWTTRVTVDRQSRVYVCTATATPSQTQANGLWVLDLNAASPQWARFADRPDGLHSQNFSHAFIHPFTDNEFWLVTQQSGIYRATWTP